MDRSKMISFIANATTLKESKMVSLIADAKGCQDKDHFTEFVGKIAERMDYLVKKEVNASQANLCYAKKMRAVITPDGVYPCANLRGNKKWYLGNPQKENLAFIWRRNNLMEIKPDETCRGYCARREFNIYLECLAQADKKGASLINYLNSTGNNAKTGDEDFI